MHRKLMHLTIVLTLLLLPTTAALADVSQAIVTDLTPEQAVAMFGKAPGSALTAEDSAAIFKQRYDGDTLKVLAVLVEWNDRPGTYSPQTFDSMLFSRDVYPTGSMADWFFENTYGQLVVTGDVYGWYNGGTYNSNFDFESLLPDLDDVIDFSDYDANNDGVADAVIFVRSGTGEEDSHDPDDIWSYAYIYQLGSGPGPFDGVMISRWNTDPELRPLHDPAHPPSIIGDSLNGIRVYCHETTHNLGYYDLYDYDDKLVFSTYQTPNDNNDHPVYDWDIMGYGGYGYFSIKGPNPSHMCGYTKEYLGFIEPTYLIGEHVDLVINAIETSSVNSLFKIPLSSDGMEYFLIEYRNPYSPAKFDKTDSDFSSWFYNYMTLGADTLDRGLLITHVDDNLPYWSNNGTPTYPHYRVAVEDAGYHPTRDYTFNPGGVVSDSAQWWYPWETRKGALFSSDVPYQNEFSPTTTPNSNSYYTGATGVIVRVDSIVDNQLYAYVNNPNAFDSDGDGIADFVDNCPDIPNADQFNNDGDPFGNACDNCPDIYNLVQADWDSDSVGNDCDNCIWVANPDQFDDDEDGIGNACDFPGGSPRIDTISTDCLSLVIRPDGNIGNQGGPDGTVNMDYTNSGECDANARVYLFDGSPVIGHVEDMVAMGDNCLFHPLHGNQSRLLPIVGGNPWQEATVEGDYEVACSGTFLCHDSTIGMDKTWYAPRNSAGDCNYIIQVTKAYSWDGLSHAGLTFGEIVDFDIPSDPPGLNTGGFDPTRNLVYLRGADYYQQYCQDHSTRFGGLAFVGAARHSAVGFDFDPLAYPYGAATLSNQTVLWPHQQYPADTILIIMHDLSGFSAFPSEEDQHLLMTYAIDETLGPDDTLYYYTVLITVHSGSIGTLGSAVDNAKARLGDLIPGCCQDPTGNVNGDPGDSVDLSDLIFLVNYLFLGGPEPPCIGEANIDGDPACNIDLSDLIRLVNYLFLSGPFPADCSPACP